MQAVVSLVLFVGYASYTQQACYLGADVALVLDISENATDQDEVHVRSFGQKLLDLASANELTLMTLVTYRCYAVTRFTFDDWYHDEARGQFLDVFQKLRAQGYQTHHGLLLLREKIFTSCYGSRDNINKVMILVTDRPSSDITVSKRRAKALKGDGVIIYLVVIGSSLSDEEIREYPSDMGTVIRADSFRELEVAFNNLKNAVFDCGPCPDGWIKSSMEDGFCYKLVKTPLMSWSTAKANCLAMNNRSRLVEFDDKRQVNWFRDEYMGRGQVNIWSGYHRDDASKPFTGINDTVVQWKEGYPKEGDCVYYTSDGMVNADCEEDNVSVCQLSQSDAEEFATPGTAG